jgi:hypothetical protein
LREDEKGGLEALDVGVEGSGGGEEGAVVNVGERDYLLSD